MAKQPSFTISVEGRKELERTFNALPVALQRKALRPALRDAAKVVREEVVHAAQSMLGKTNPMPPHVADHIKVRAMKRDRSKRGRLGMVVMAGKRALLGIKGSTYYPAHVEFGHMAGPRVHGPLQFDETKRGPDGKYLPKTRTKAQAEKEMQGVRRHVPAIPFMRTGLLRAKDRALAVFADTLSATLKKLAGAPDMPDNEFYADIGLGADESADIS